jgi:hypothetical protein
MGCWGVRLRIDDGRNDCERGERKHNCQWDDTGNHGGVIRKSMLGGINKQTERILQLYFQKLYIIVQTALRVSFYFKAIISHRQCNINEIKDSKHKMVLIKDYFLILLCMRLMLAL